jgi:hypothetical protein
MPGGTNCPPTGVPAFAIARDRRSAARPVAGSLAVVGPVSRDRPRDRSLGRFGSECQPPRARFRMDVRNNLHKGLVHKRALRHPDLSTNIGSPLRSVEKLVGLRCRAHGTRRRVATRVASRDRRIASGGTRSLDGSLGRPGILRGAGVHSVEDGARVILGSSSSPSTPAHRRPHSMLREHVALDPRPGRIDAEAVGPDAGLAQLGPWRVPVPGLGDQLHGLNRHGE